MILGFRGSWSRPRAFCRESSVSPITNVGRVVIPGGICYDEEGPTRKKKEWHAATRDWSKWDESSCLAKHLTFSDWKEKVPQGNNLNLEEPGARFVGWWHWWHWWSRVILILGTPLVSRRGVAQVFFYKLNQKSFQHLGLAHCLNSGGTWRQHPVGLPVKPGAVLPLSGYTLEPIAQPANQSMPLRNKIEFSECHPFQVVVLCATFPISMRWGAHPIYIYIV